MAATFVAQFQAATDQVFVQRVEMGMLQTANNLSTEQNTHENHANRMTLMRAVTNSPSMWAPMFALLIASAGIDGSSTDAQIQAQISSSWDAMAGQV